eukprot:TRINITY_DN6494_c0_g1_i1.p1 TRINITY_DN6494_c0_g1~~TRINITY_DN6494_c0_g1_i1.p1  ORF type:complete len:192 (-),score=3.40 TRINITY_DN6494_c0_g1_i1:158-706(-)
MEPAGAMSGGRRGVTAISGAGVEATAGAGSLEATAQLLSSLEFAQRRAAEEASRADELRRKLTKTNAGLVVTPSPVDGPPAARPPLEAASAEVLSLAATSAAGNALSAEQEEHAAGLGESGVVELRSAHNGAAMDAADSGTLDILHQAPMQVACLDANDWARDYVAQTLAWELNKRRGAGGS